MKALIPAAGLGTRFLPATKSQPKEMLLVCDKPAIQFVVEEGLASDADEVVIINSRSKTSIEHYFQRDPDLVKYLRSKGKDKYADEVERVGDMNVTYVYQNKARGLGHAIWCAHDRIGNEPFYVLLGDVLVPRNGVLPAMQKVSDAHGGASVIAVMKVPHEDVSRFGVIDGKAVEGEDGVYKVDRLVEKPPVDEAPTDYAIFGRYLLTPRVMQLLKNAKPTTEGEIQLTDALDAVLKEEEMFALVVDSEDGYDTGTLETWMDTNIKLYKRKFGALPGESAN